MGSDASIYNMIRPQAVVPLENPDDIRAKQMTLRHLMQQQEAGALGLQKTRRDFEKEDAFSKLFSGGTMPTEAQMYGADPTRAATAMKSRLDAKKTQSDIDKNSLEGQIKTIERVSSILATAKDQPSYDMALREIANTFGPNAIEGKPPQFDPAFVRATVAKGQTITQQLADLRAQETQAQTVARDTATNARGVESNLTTRRGQNMTAGTAAASLAETRANNARPVYDQDRGGFATRPQPGVTPSFIPATGAPKGQKEIIATREDTDKLRQEFEAKPAVKQYRDVLPIAASAKQAPDTRAGDIQMAYAVGKILDPNSVVREGELKLVGNAATAMQQVEGELRTLTQGKGRLTPQTRAQLNEMLENAVANRKASFEAEKGSYGGIVQRRGYKPEDVFIDVPAERRAAPSASETKVVGGKTYVKQNDQWFERN